MEIFIKKILSIMIIWGVFSMPCSSGAYLQPSYQEDLQKLEELWQKEQTEAYQPISKTIKAGENLLIQLTEEINAEILEEGDEINAKLLTPIKAKGQIIVPEGSIIKGEVIQNIKNSSWKNPQRLEIKFNEISIDETTNLPIEAKIKTKDDTGILEGENLLSFLKNSLPSLFFTIIGVVGLFVFVYFAMPSYFISIPLGGITGFLVGKRWLNTSSHFILIPQETLLIITLQKDLVLDDL